jgi:hypothetical protein
MVAPPETCRYEASLMQTFNRICLKDYEITDDNGRTAGVKRGEEYLTSNVNAAPAIGPEPIENCVIVFGAYWFPVPVSVFGGETEFTPS